MTKFYATRDFDDGSIKQDATIAAFDTTSEATSYLLAGFSPTDWNHSTAIIEAGEFGDCWIKIYGPLKNVDTAPFCTRDLFIQSPGQHPGGKATWITPLLPVLVVSRIDETEENA